MPRTFSQMLQAIRKTDDALRGAVSEAASYIIFQYHVNGRKVDGAGVSLKAQLIAALPAWLQKDASRWQLDSGKRNKDMGEREATARADAFVGTAFASREETRRIARENRAAKAAQKAQEGAAIAPESTNASKGIATPTLEMGKTSNALVLNGNTIEISAEEADALATILTSIRQRQQVTFEADVVEYAKAA